MEEKEAQAPYKRFNGAAWAEQQIRKRTRAELAARGSRAPTHSREYQLEYALQKSLFSAERIEKKRQKKLRK